MCLLVIMNITWNSRLIVVMVNVGVILGREYVRWSIMNRNDSCAKSWRQKSHQHDGQQDANREVSGTIKH